MQTTRTAFKVGLFAVLGALFLLGTVFYLSGLSLDQGQDYETYFEDSVQGLDVGTAVKFHGVTIGQVTDVGLVYAEYPNSEATDNARILSDKVYRQIVVRFRVNQQKLGNLSNVSILVVHGLRAQLQPQGITGLSYIDLTFVSPKQYPIQPVPWTPRSTVIPSIPSTLAQLQTAAQQAITALGNANLPAMLTELSSLLKTMNDEMTTGDGHQILASADTLVNNLNNAVQQSNLPATTAAIRNLAGGPQTTQILTQLNQTTQQLAKVSAALPSVIASSQATIQQANETTADLQAQLLPILQDLKTAAGNLRDLSATLSANPSQAILGAPPPPPQGNQ